MSKTAAVARAGMNKEVKTLVMGALMTALLAVCSQLSIPIQPIPINLALLAVYLAAFLLEGRGALISVGIYLLLGAFGLPVFANFKGGLQALVGPTGGYLMGYLFTAAVITTLKPWADNFLKRCLVMALGLLACYVPGTLWFMMLNKMSLQVSLGYCVYPFLPGDAVKIVLAALLAPRLQQAIARI